VLSEQQSQLTSYQWRKVGLSEKEREWPFAIELLWRFSCSEEYHGFSSYFHCYGPALSPPTPGASEKVIWCTSIALGPYSLSYLCAPRPSISLILDLMALPPLPASPSPTQAPSVAPTPSISKLIMQRHARIAFFRLSPVNLAHITSRLLIAPFPMTL